MHIRSLVLVSVSFVACHSRGANHTDRCNELAPHVWTAGGGKEEPGSSSARSIEAIADACRNDAWTSELMTCFEGATDLKSNDPCTSLISESQRSHLERAYEVGRHKSDDTASVPEGGGVTPTPPPPAASHYSCFTYVNKIVGDTQITCGQDCAGLLGGMTKLRESGLATNVTDCVPAASVWCFTSGQDESCHATRERCESRRDLLSHGGKLAVGDCTEKH